MFDRLRKNHAVEHATIAVLHERRGRIVSVAGHSDPRGFNLYGPFAADEVESAAREALDRLRAGERSLAITHFCGTNLAVTGLLTAVAAVFTAGRNRRRLPDAVAAATLATVVAARTGLWLQRSFTTDARVGGLQVLGISERPLRGNGHVVRVRLG